MEQLAEAFRTVFRKGTGEIIIKKSRFIANIYPADTEAAAVSLLETIRKQYWDASHNCYAYIIGTRNPLMRCSDDGEPSQTAGKPMLDVLTAHGLTNLIAVVTRYFGGTLLGTGGLVKAYQGAVIEGLNNSTIIKKELGNHLQLTIDYSQVGKIQYYISQEAIPVLSSEYTDTVKLDLLVLPGRLAAFQKKIAELTNGSALIVKKEQVYFTFMNNEVHLF